MRKSKIIFLASVYCLFTGLVSIYLGQDFNWDLKNYHLYNPYHLLESRWDIDVLAAQIQTFFNPTIDIPFYLAIFHWKLPPILIGFLLGCIQGLNLFLLHLIALQILPKFRNINLLIFLSVLVAAGGAIFFSQIGTVFGDSLTSWLVLLGLYLMILSSKETDPSKKYLLLAGLSLGIATALKYTNSIHTISLIIALNLISRTSILKQTGYLLLGASLGFITFAGYWLSLLWIQVGNPVLPLLNDIFQSPYLDTEAFKDLRFYPKSWSQFFFYPVYFLKTQHLPWEMPFRDPRLLICMLSVITLGFLIIFKKRFSTQRFLPISNQLTLIIIYLFIGYFIWIKIFCYYRYIIPFELLAIIIFLALVFTFQMKQYIQVALISIVLMTTVAWTKIPDWGRTTWTTSWAGIDEQSLLKFENATIVIANREPVSYIIPYFPKSTRFVRIRANLLFNNQEGLLIQKAIKIINQTPAEKLFLLDFQSTNYQPNPRLSADLQRYQLTLNQSKCEPLNTKVDQFLLCQLKHK